MRVPLLLVLGFSLLAIHGLPLRADPPGSGALSLLNVAALLGALQISAEGSPSLVRIEEEPRVASVRFSLKLGSVDLR